ncbi:membrane protein [Candidatus Magnetobacterium bavaricum]|uniref:Membrane protein n=1 Tax=Candidatus Magnetobacterium bavaricum TaxID=29290 RepID=A0A0F3GXQ3_9BACT|nr:membrane protein [Candidatus Magnetobacterium bavaricum]
MLKNRSSVGNSDESNGGASSRATLSERHNLIVALIILITVLVVMTVAIVAHQPVAHNEAVNITQHSLLAFIVVFLCYGIAAVLLVMFFAYRILSPFGRLLKDMEVILSGDMTRRLFLRDKDVYLIKCFVTNVNALLDNVEKMHISQSELIKDIDSEGRAVMSLLEQDNNMDGKTKEAILSYHDKVKSIVKSTPASK